MRPEFYSAGAFVMAFYRRNCGIVSKRVKSSRGMARKATLCLTVAVFFGIGLPMRAQSSSNQGTETPVVDPIVQRNVQDWATQSRGVPDDWSHHYQVFSNPGTEQQANESGNYEHWLKVVNDSRFTLQQIKRNGKATLLEGMDSSIANQQNTESFNVEALGSQSHGPTGPVLQNPRRGQQEALKKDWNVSIGGVAASATGTVTTNSATGTSTVTVDGQALTASAPTAASATGIFTGAPGAGQSVTIKNGSNVLSLKTNATTASAIGTVSTVPTSTTAPTIVLTNSSGSNPNTLTLTTNMSGATVTGTITGTGPTAGQTITIGNGLSSNTLTLTLNSGAGTPGTGTVTVSNSMGAANGDTVTIGSVVYTFEETTTAFSGQPFTGTQYYCQNTTSPCVWWGTTAANQAQALFAAITNNPAACPTTAQGLYGNWQYTCYSYITAPNPSVTATLANPGTGAVISLINTSNTAAPFLTSSSQSAFTLSSSAGTLPVTANACSSSTVGIVSPNATPATEAAYLATAINACYAAYPAVGVTATAVGSVVTVQSTTMNSAASTITVGGTASNFSWSSVTAGSYGTNGCSNSTTGTFASGSTTASVASNIAAAINSCNTSYPAIGITASYSSGSTFTVTNPTPGPYLAVTGANLGSLYSWGAVTGGSAGTNTCTSSTSGTFATSITTTTLATNLAAAVNDCPAAAGVTASASSSTVTVTARTAGTTGNSIALGNTLSSFSWSGGNLSGGADGTTSGTTFAYWSGAAAVSPTQLAANIAAAINANTTLQTVATGVAATSNGGVVTVTARTPGAAGNSITTAANLTGFSWSGNLSGGVAGATGQPNLFPAKYTFSITTANCSDFVVYPTGTTGATGGASILAFSNLYTGGCTGTVPSAYWAYNTGGMATTSPVLSLDGSQVAFVQVSGTTASLVLLKWSASNGTPYLPVTPASATAATYRSCAAPCMLNIPFSGNHNDSISAPYYDYADDIAYVGDDSGNLHKFTGIFAGSPAEASSPWPVNLGGNKISTPVYDSTTGHVIVGDMGGSLYSVTAATGTIYGTASGLGDAIADAPLVDSSAGEIYVFVTTSGSYAATGSNAVYEFPTNFTTFGTPGVKAVGTGGAGYYLYSGTFDNVYYESANPTGNIYVVGGTGATTGASLYRIPVNNSVMGTPVAVVSGLNSTVHPWPSPVTEFCNNGVSNCTASATQTTAGTDLIFFSVASGAQSGCTNAVGDGCVLSFNVSNPAAVSQSGSGLNVTTPTGTGCWATGAIVVDNSVPTGTMAGASQIYFLGLGNNAAGGPTGTTQTSTYCTAGTASTIAATQASQTNP